MTFGFNHDLIILTNDSLMIAELIEEYFSVKKELKSTTEKIQ